MSGKEKKLSLGGTLRGVRLVLSLLPFIALFFPCCVLAVKYAAFTASYTFSLTGLSAILDSGAAALAKTLSASAYVGGITSAFSSLVTVFSVTAVTALLLVAADVLSFILPKAVTVVMAAVSAVGTVCAGLGTYSVYKLSKLTAKSEIFSFRCTYTFVGVLVAFAALLAINLIILLKCKSKEPKEEKTKSSRTKAIIAAAVATAIVVGGLLFAFGSSGKTSKAEPAKAPASETKTGKINDKTVINPDDKMSILGYYAGRVMSVYDKDKIKVDINTKLCIDDKSLVVSESSDMLLAALRFMQPQLLTNTQDMCLQHEGKYGEDKSPYIPAVNFGVNDMSDVQFTDGYIDSNGNSVDKEYHLIHIELPSYDYDKVPMSIYSSTGLDGTQSVIFRTTESFNKVVNITSESTMKINKISIDARVKRETDAVESITITRVYNVVPTVCFIGELQKIGTKDIRFLMTAKTTYSFTYK